MVLAYTVHPIDVDGMANSVDPNETASLGAEFGLVILEESGLGLHCLFMLICPKTFTVYRNVPKFLDRQVWANSADPDQTAPRGAV